MPKTSPKVVWLSIPQWYSVVTPHVEGKWRKIQEAQLPNYPVNKSIRFVSLKPSLIVSIESEMYNVEILWAISLSIYLALRWFDELFNNCYQLIEHFGELLCFSWFCSSLRPLRYWRDMRLGILRRLNRGGNNRIEEALSLIPQSCGKVSPTCCLPTPN